MSYQALARKWRPQDFSSVVGQQPIVTGLRNALTEGRIAQAYLFSGIRGVGKTSVARVLAKALNCENGPASDPCNACTPCQEITRGADLDVLEVDAATYSKVEQVRELTESLKYGAARDRYKVVVLDEVHRLSRQAFDALLKIVEEPPPHLVFIFATTEIDAVPATILSRCQEYRFRRVATPELVEHLRAVCDAEGIEASDAALVALARAGEGSVRDAVAMLDQLATYGNSTITDEEAGRVLGGLGNEFCEAVLAALLAGDRERVVTLARQVEEGGHDPRHVHAQLLAHSRAALHLAASADAQWLDLPATERESLSRLAAESGYENLLRLLHHLLASESIVRRSDVAGLALEIAWLRAAELPRLVEIESLLGGRSPGAPDTPSRTPRKEPPRAAEADGPAAALPEPTRPEPEKAEAEKPEPLTSERRTEEESAAAAPPAKVEPEPPAEEATPPAAPQGSVDRLLEEVDRRRAALAAHLQEAVSVAVVDGVLQISARAGDHWLERALRRPNNRSSLEAAIEAAFGEPVPWKLVATSETADTLAPTREEPEPVVPPAVTEHPTVQAVLDIFGGRVESIEPQDQERP